jgi:aldose 1-epimerase
MTSLVTLSAHGFTLGLLPELGGSVAWLSWQAPDGRKRPLLRPSDATAIASANPSNLACFPLVPFANRIAGSRFPFRGREHVLPVNRPPDPTAIHGFGFQAPWRVEAIDEATVRLHHEHRTPGSPFRYRAEQVFRLRPGAVSIAIAVTHDGADEMPYGIGLHPWFPRPPETWLTLSATTVFAPDETLLPRAPEPVAAEADFSAGRRADDAVPLNGCFAGWDGRAAIRWPREGHGIDLAADPAFRAAQLFLPDDRAVLCVEPVSHVPNVHNHPEWAEFGGLHVLGPGATLGGGMTIRPVAL